MTYQNLGNVTNAVEKTHSFLHTNTFNEKRN